MKVFISMPMKGKTAEEISIELEKNLEEVKTLTSSSMELLDANLSLGDTATEYDYIGESIKLLGKADAIYFADDWQSSDSCLVERVVAELYCPDKIIQKK